ncbi:MAG: peptidoglycan DD-metalloendopeptidase family protein [Firmicutes bacterium]|nr:peptidoglycan DD-metalloendopeptidase family protein [Bacillota bacterium]
MTAPDGSTNSKRPLIAALALLLAIFLLLADWTGPVLAGGHNLVDEMQEKEQKLQQVQKGIAEAERLLKETKKQEQSATTVLRRLEQSLEDAQNEYNTLAGKTKETEEQLKVTADKLTRTETRLDLRYGQYRQRVRALYMEGSVGFIQVLLQARDLFDFLSRFDLLKTIISYDNRLIAEIRDIRSAVSTEKSNLEAKKNELENLREKARQQNNLLQSRKTSHSVYLAGLRNDIEAYEKALDEYEDLSRRLVDEIRKLQEELAKQRRAFGSGKLIWPAPGYTTITSPFGWRIHPITRKKRFHSGIDIRVPYDKKVIAADSGVVIKAGLLGGYGYTVIIDHGKGRSTLYAHNSKVLVKENQVVAKGETIARSGSSGLSTGPHVHFEVRINGEPFQPLDFVSP